MAKRTWEQREVPLLEVIAEDEEKGSTSALASEEVGRRAGLDPRLAEVGLRGLHRAGYIRGIDVASHDGWGLIDITLEERGRRAVGQWPSENAYEEFLQLLDDRLARTEDEEERSRLRQFRAAASDVGRGVISSVIVELGKRMAGMP